MLHQAANRLRLPHVHELMPFPATRTCVRLHPQRNPQEGKGKLMGALVAGTAVAGGVAVCSADHVPSIDYGWNHHGLLASYDYPA